MIITPKEKKRLIRFCEFATSGRIEMDVRYSDGSYGHIRVDDFQQMLDKGGVEVELLCRKCGDQVNIKGDCDEDDYGICGACAS